MTWTCLTDAIGPYCPAPARRREPFVGVTLRPSRFLPVAETQRERVPRNDAGEADTALAFLAFARKCVLKKTTDLDDEQLRRVLVESGTSLLGLVQHLTDGEHYWFGYTVAGRGDDNYDFSMDVPSTRSAEKVISAYRDAISASDDILRATDLDALVAISPDEKPTTVRWVVAHMTGETTRHAGHADILRELIDGVTGR